MELNEDGNPLSSLVRALSGRRLTLVENGEIVHPFRGLANASSRFSASLNIFLESLSKADLADHTSTGHDAAARFQDLVYRATELFDVYSIDLLKSLGKLADSASRKVVKDYRATVQRRRNDWALICNKLKHNHNVLAPTRYTYFSGRVVDGFALCRPETGNKLAPNKGLHKGRETARSYNLVLRQLVTDILRVDVNAAEFIRKIPDSGDRAISRHDQAFSIGAAMRHIERRPAWPMQNETSKFDGFRLSDADVSFERQSAETIREAARVSVLFKGDGITNVFQVP